MRSSRFKSEVRKNSRPASDGISFFSSRQETFRKLYKLEPDKCLRSITEELRKSLDCETVCILLWNEGEQKLVTEYDSGLPESLGRAEEYGPHEGVTGATIFSENRWVRCLIDMKAHRIDDMQMRTRIDDESTNWHNMEAFASNSTKGDFRSLLGAPFSVRNQKLGVVKLINKLDGNGRLDDDGFKVEDVKTLSYFLDAIEHVVEIKRNEKQVQSLLHVGQKIIGSDFGHEEVLEEIVTRCASALNYRICLIRLLENDRLYVRASNMPPSGREELDARHTPYLSAVELKIPIKGSYQEDPRGRAQLQLFSAEGLKKIKLSKVNSRFTRFLHRHSLKSFLIVPIIRQGSVIGTIECYTSLPRDFSAQELDAIRLYVDALVITTINSRQQQLLTNLIELQRIGSVSDEAAGKEERVIAGVLNRMRELLGRKLKVLAVIFSRERLAQSNLARRELYGASRKELRDALGALEFQTILDGLHGPTRREQAGLRRGKAGSAKAERAAKSFLKFEIPPDNEGAPLGALVLGFHGTVSDDEFPHQVARLGAAQLGVLLGNIEEFRRSKELLKIIDDAPLKNTLGDMYGFILNQTTGFFGFDFGAIAKVDYIGRRVETVMAQSAKPDLVDQTEWMLLSAYGLDE
jgi:GAF domain-containing protein